jgi:hypothetical protein
MRYLSLIAAGLLIAALPLGAADKDGKTPGLTVDKDKRTITIDAKVAPRKLEAFNDVYPIEVIACWPYRKEPPTKAHETVVTFDYETKPSMVHKALEDLGLKPGKPVKGGEDVPEGPEVKIFLEFEADGATKKIPVQRGLVGQNPKFKLPEFKWRFTGSVMKAPDPNKPDVKVYGADITGTLISVFPVTDETVFQSQMSMKEEKFLKLDANKETLPKVGTPLKLIIEVPEAKK